jgi:spore coat protein U-like protein
MTPPCPVLYSFARGLGCLLGAASLLLGGASAEAAPPNGGCFVSGGQLSFGVYDPLSNQPKLMETAVTLDCHRSVDQVTLVLDSGAASAPGGRQMRSGSAALRYELYRDVTRTDLCRNGCSITRNKQELKDVVDVRIYGASSASTT